MSQDWTFESHPTELQGREKSWKLNESPMASEFINQTYVMKPP